MDKTMDRFRRTGPERTPLVDPDASLRSSLGILPPNLLSELTFGMSPPGGPALVRPPGDHHDLTTTVPGHYLKAWPPEGAREVDPWSAADWTGVSSLPSRLSFMDSADLSNLSISSEALLSKSIATKPRSTSLGGGSTSSLTGLGQPAQSERSTIRNERFSDFSGASKDFPPGDAGLWDPQEGGDQVGFGEVVGDNLQFMAEEEAAFIEEHQFDLPHEVSLSGLSTLGAEDPPAANKSAALSVSNYFLMSSSRLGSLETHEEGQGPPGAVQRPSLGLGPIRSPQKKLPARVMDDTFKVPEVPPIRAAGPSTKETAGPAVPEPPSALLSNSCMKSSQLEGQGLGAIQRPSLGNGSIASPSRKPAPGIKDGAFRVPEAPPPRTSPKGNHPAALQFRHSSPMAPTRSLPTPAAPASLNQQFPLTVDKVRLVWLALDTNYPPDEGEENLMKACFKNVTPDDLVVKVTLVDSPKAFVIQDGPGGLVRTQTVPVGPHGYGVVVVRVVPPEDVSGGGVLRGKLVLKPSYVRGGGQAVVPGKGLKATLSLLAHLGTPRFEFDPTLFISWKSDPLEVPSSSKEMVLMVVGEDLSSGVDKEATVKNVGTAPGFVCCKVFADPHLRVPSTSVEICPSLFVLDSGGSRQVRIRVQGGCLPSAQWGTAGQVAQLVIISGPEACRQALLASKVTSSDLVRSFTMGIDLGEVGSDAPGASPKVPRGVQRFDEEWPRWLRKMSKQVVGVHLVMPGPQDFVVPPIEETLNESRMNCSSWGVNPGMMREPPPPPAPGSRPAALRPVAPVPAVRRVFDPIKEEETRVPPSGPSQQPRPEAEGPSAAVSATSGSSSLRAPSVAAPPPSQASQTLNQVRLERDRVFIPPVKVGGSHVAKVTIKNPGLDPVRLRVERIEPPFACNHSLIEVKPRSFVSLPVVYAPREHGRHRACIRLIPVDPVSSLPTLEAVLRASTLQSSGK